MLTLLYDKTFPPRPATSAQTIGINKSLGRLLSADEDMRQFNYYGGGGAPNIEDFTEADIAKLE